MNTKTFKSIVFVSTIFLISVSTAFCGDVIVLKPTDDTFIDEYMPNEINGPLARLMLRRLGLSGWELHTLLKFDLSSIPAGTKIKSAKLNLYYYYYYINDGDPVGDPFDVYRITDDWDETTTTWNNQPGYDPTLISSINCPEDFNWIQWDVTSCVQDFVDGTETNYGWQIIDTATSHNHMTYFRSKDYTDDSNEHPYLEIETECSGEWGYHSGDINKDCYVNFIDVAILANHWLWSSDPNDPCGIPGEQTFIGAGFAFDGNDEIGPATILFLYDNLNEGVLEPNDIILEYEGHTVGSGKELLDVIKTIDDKEPGETVEMVVKKGMDVYNIVASQELHYSLGFAGWIRYLDRTCVKRSTPGGATTCSCSLESPGDECWQTLSEIVVHKSPYAQCHYMSMKSQCYNITGQTRYNVCEATAGAETVMLIGK